MHKHKKGKIAEFITALYYLCKLYYPLHSRYKTKLGEVDLILLRGQTLVFVEVKARHNGLHEDIVSHVQQQRIKNTAQLFIARNPRYQNYNIRFDLSVVKPYSLPEIIKNAW